MVTIKLFNSILSSDIFKRKYIHYQIHQIFFKFLKIIQIDAIN